MIVGAGMSGLCMGAKLSHAGLGNFRILEKRDDIGGTWRENRYPGLTCDVPASFYSYRFGPDPGWRNRFASAPEIHAYLRAVADHFDLERSIRYRQEVTSATFADGVWHLETGAGEQIDADVLIHATGVLHHPRIPPLPGLETFAGHAFHSARWDPDVAIDGSRLGVIGTGSTGIQIVTATAGRAKRVTQFQRTAQWVLPWPHRAYRAPQRNHAIHYAVNRSLFEVLGEGLLHPGWQRRAMQGLCRANLRVAVRDPELRAKLTPDYEPLCKRLVMSAGYYRAVQKRGVEVVTAAVERIIPEGVQTADGRVHHLDTLVLATGFDAHAFMRPMKIAGSRRTLAEAWADGPRTHLTTMIPGFPNMFLLMGPNSPVGNTSLVPIAEAQADFALHWIRRIAAGQIASVAPTQEAADAFNREIRDNMGDTVWTTGCDSWYIGPDGTPTLWPFSMRQFWRRLAEIDEREFTAAPVGAATTAAVAVR